MSKWPERVPAKRVPRDLATEGHYRAHAGELAETADVLAQQLSVLRRATTQLRRAYRIPKRTRRARH